MRLFEHRRDTGVRAGAQMNAARHQKISDPAAPASNSKDAARRRGILRNIIAAAGLLAMGNHSSAGAQDRALMAIEVNSLTDLNRLPPDLPEGTGATVRLISLKRAANVKAPMLSTFLIDYEPGGSAVLRRSTGPGYVLLHVLSGSIRAEAWHAGVGFYHAGQTWVQPALANDITSNNASTTEPARALVILITAVE